MTRRFRIGEFIATPDAEKVLFVSGQLPSDFLERHLRGDWGEVPDEVRALNEQGLDGAGRLFSAYKTFSGETIWIVTEADRSKTTLMLPDEFSGSPSGENDLQVDQG